MAIWRSCVNEMCPPFRCGQHWEDQRELQADLWRQGTLYSSPHHRRGGQGELSVLVKCMTNNGGYDRITSVEFETAEFFELILLSCLVQIVQGEENPHRHKGNPTSGDPWRPHHPLPWSSDQGQRHRPHWPGHWQNHRFHQIWDRLVIILY